MRCQARSTASGGDVLRRRLHREPAVAARVRAALQGARSACLLVLHLPDARPAERTSCCSRMRGSRRSRSGIQSGSEQVLDEYNRPVAQQKCRSRRRRPSSTAASTATSISSRKVQFETEETAARRSSSCSTSRSEMKTVGFGAMVLVSGLRLHGAGRGAGRRAHPQRRGLRVLPQALPPHAHRAAPSRVKRAVGSLKVFRRFPKLIDPLLPEDAALLLPRQWRPRSRRRQFGAHRRRRSGNPRAAT